MEEKEEKVEEVKPEYAVDLTQMQTKSRLSSLRQEGNYLVGTTDRGVTFRQRIPQGKILDKVDGKYRLKDMEIVNGA